MRRLSAADPRLEQSSVLAGRLVPAVLRIAESEDEREAGDGSKHPQDRSRKHPRLHCKNRARRSSLGQQSDERFMTMKNRLKFNKRLALSAVAAAIAATSLATASPALASNPTPHPGGDPAGVLNPDSMKPTDSIRVVWPEFVINPDSMKPTDSIRIIDPHYVINPDSMKPTDSRTRRARR